MIFVGYEPGSKGYQFWDAAHQHFEISRDVKFEETQFPAKESKLTQPTPAPLGDRQIPESDNESDSLGLDLVNPAHPPARPPIPGQTAVEPPSPPLPRAPRGSHTPLQPPVPRYSFHQTVAREQQ